MIGQPGLLHGGAIASMIAAAADQMVGDYVARRDPASTFTLITTNLDYLNLGFAEPTKVTVGIVRAGRRVINVIGEAVQTGGRTIARANLTYLTAVAAE